jgi:tetratricopeptide (TPR) repeat protein
LITSAQDFKAQADSLRKEGNLEAAIESYRMAIAGQPDDFSANYNLACSFSLLNRKDSAFHYLNIALPMDSTVLALRDPDLYYLQEDARWDQLEQEQIGRIEAAHQKYQNLPLAKELWKMGRGDQAFYYQIKLADDKMGRPNPVSTGLWYLKEGINKQNQERLIDIIENHGWPKSSEVGGAAAGVAFLVIQHASLELQKKYIPMIEKACQADEARWSSYALMYDRIQIRENRPQKYGSQVRYNENGEYEPFPIEEPAYVNQRRKEVGLGPIEEYLGRWNITWEVEQKEK